MNGIKVALFSGKIGDFYKTRWRSYGYRCGLRGDIRVRTHISLAIFIGVGFIGHGQKEKRLGIPFLNGSYRRCSRSFLKLGVCRLGPVHEGWGAVAVIPENPFKAKEAKSIICPLDSFIVNLMDKSGQRNRYLKETMTLEVGSDRDRELLQKHMQQIRDTVLLRLSSISFKEIDRMEGKLDLKQSLISRINRVPVENRIKEFYFSEFVVQ